MMNGKFLEMEVSHMEVSHMAHNTKLSIPCIRTGGDAACFPGEDVKVVVHPRLAKLCFERFNSLIGIEFDTRNNDDDSLNSFIDNEEESSGSKKTKFANIGESAKVDGIVCVILQTEVKMEALRNMENNDSGQNSETFGGDEDVYMSTGTRSEETSDNSDSDSEGTLSVLSYEDDAAYGHAFDIEHSGEITERAIIPYSTQLPIPIVPVTLYVRCLRRFSFDKESRAHNGYEDEGRRIILIREPRTTYFQYHASVLGSHWKAGCNARVGTKLLSGGAGHMPAWIWRRFDNSFLCKQLVRHLVWEIDQNNSYSKDTYDLIEQSFSHSHRKHGTKKTITDQYYYECPPQHSVDCDRTSSSISMNPCSTSIPYEMSYKLMNFLPLDRENRMRIIRLVEPSDRIKYMMTVLKSGIRSINCGICGARLARSCNAVFVESGVSGTFCNPSGFVHGVLTVSNLSRGARVQFHSYRELNGTWFEGYMWQIATCGLCGQHIGWKYFRVKPKSDGMGMIDNISQAGARDTIADYKLYNSEIDSDLDDGKPTTFWGLRSAAVKEVYES